jgi:hypothetical protein
MTTKGEAGSPKVHTLLAGSSLARAIVRIAGKGRSEFDIYNEYMTTIGGFIPTPNPKADVAMTLAALKKSGLITEERNVLTSTEEALAQVKQIPVDDLTADIVQTPGFRSLISDGLMVNATIACCSTSTSCKCTSSSSSSSVELPLAAILE